MKIKNVHIGQKLKLKKCHILSDEIVKVIEVGEDGYIKVWSIFRGEFWEHCYYLKKYNVGEVEPC